MSVRKITNTGNKKNIGRFPSLKLKRNVWWESQIERDYIYLLEFDTQVISYAEQPLKVSYRFNTKIHHYTPDFLKHSCNKKQIIEVKPKKKLLEIKIIEMLHIVAQLLENEGYEFLVVTDEQIRIQPKLNNIKLLWKYARKPLPSWYQAYCEECFQNKNAVSLKEVIDFFSTKNISKETIFALMYHQVFDTDLMLPITDISLLRLSMNYNWPIQYAN